jgi:hypothetical protein
LSVGLIETLDQDQFERVCGWFTTLPNYMFAPGLSARLIDFAYRTQNLQKADQAVRTILVYQGSLLEPLAPEAFIELCEQFYADSVPAAVADFLQRENTH